MLTFVFITYFSFEVGLFFIQSNQGICRSISFIRGLLKLQTCNFHTDDFQAMKNCW